MPRLIDADALVDALMTYTWRDEDDRLIDDADEKREYIKQWLPDLPTVSDWVSVKDDMPEEHNSIFANYTHLSKHMWAKESDHVIVYVRFPDGTGRVTEGRLQDGKWWTRISPALEPIVTHWMPLPTSPEVDDGNN